MIVRELGAELACAPGLRLVAWLGYSTAFHLTRPTIVPTLLVRQPQFGLLSRLAPSGSRPGGFFI